MSADAILLMQFHTVAAIVRSGFWNALRHGHFAYYSTPVLVRMAAELGLTAVSAWEYPLYGGTILLALAKEGSRWGDPAENVTSLVDREIAEGVLEPTAVASLNESLASSAAALSYVSRGCKVSLRNRGRLQCRISDVGVDPVWPRHCPRPRRSR